MNKNILIHFIVIIILVIGFCFLFYKNGENKTKPTDLTNISMEGDTINVSGILDLVNGKDFYKRYTKSIKYECKSNKCILLTATYVDNGKLQPNLYPDYENCEIINKNNMKITGQCGACISVLDINKKEFILTCSDTIYKLSTN